MPKDTPQVDHRIEAINALIKAFEYTRDGVSADEIAVVIARAQVHSNLAIAEGQERVAEALRAIAEPDKYGIDPRSLS